jgi:SAM-dependent methyltransferase
MIGNHPADAGAWDKILINAGCGMSRGVSRTSLFDTWRHVRVDLDPKVRPDIVADITNLSPIITGFADALWSSHCIEHLYHHQVVGALSEFRRVINDDGFVVFLVPDLQAVASFVAQDKFHDPIYISESGPISAHDMFYGHGQALAAGHTNMAHRCGFTPGSLVSLLNQAQFAEFGIRRLQTLELVVVARKAIGDPETNCEALLRSLNL